MLGQCLCGTVRFEIIDFVPVLYQCHCSLCRKQGGSTSNTSTMVATKNFRWIAGQDVISSWTKDTGFRSDFCATCGSPVPNPVRSGTAYVWVPAGLLEDDPRLSIGVHLHTGSRAPWDAIGAPGVQFESFPGAAEFLALLHLRDRG